MKIIVSHDVDHLYREDHYKDLYFLKLCVRSMINYLKKECSLKECFLRIRSIFSKKIHRINEVMEFDYDNGVSSTFFFGMKNGLGMNYNLVNAKDNIENVVKHGFDVGVHGINYEQYEEMKREYDIFNEIVKKIGVDIFGIRMHYVRFNKKTFSYLNECGYSFDTTEFDKEKGYLIKAPYKIGDMWEFPLNLMDAYLPTSLEDKQKKSLEILNRARKAGVEYFTILFHDSQYDKAYSSMYEWYRWLIGYLKEHEEYEFISYRDALKELAG